MNLHKPLPLTPFPRPSFPCSLGSGETHAGSILDAKSSYPFSTHIFSWTYTHHHLELWIMTLKVLVSRENVIRFSFSVWGFYCSMPGQPARPAGALQAPARDGQAPRWAQSSLGEPCPRSLPMATASPSTWPALPGGTGVPGSPGGGDVTRATTKAGAWVLTLLDASSAVTLYKANHEVFFKTIHYKLCILKNFDAVTVQTAFILLLNFGMGTYIVNFLKTIYTDVIDKAHVTTGWKYKEYQG